MEPIRSYARGGKRAVRRVELVGCFHKEKTRGLGTTGLKGASKGEAEGGFCDAPTIKLRVTASGSKPRIEFLPPLTMSVAVSTQKRCPYCPAERWLAGSLGQKFIEDPHDGCMVTLVVAVMSAGA